MAYNSIGLIELSSIAAGYQVTDAMLKAADVDLVLVMTVNPGFGHQHFIRTTLPKIRRVRQMIERLRPDCELELDGGIDATTARLGVAAGADVLVAGSAIFNDSESVTAAMQRLRAAVQL